MKRAAAIIICCAMITGAFASCGKSSSSSSEQPVSTEAVTETAASTEASTEAESTSQADTSAVTTQADTSSASEQKSAGEFKGEWKLKDIINKETGKSFIFDGSEDPDTSPTERIRLKVDDDKISLITVGVQTSELDYTVSSDGSISFTDESGMNYTAVVKDGEIVLENTMEIAYFTPYTGTDTVLPSETGTTEPVTEPDLSEFTGGDIVGKWTPEDDDNKFSFFIDFKADNSMLVSVDYSTFLSFKDGKAVVPYAENVETEFDGTKLTVKAEGESLFEFERISGETDKNDLNGKYKVISEKGAAPTEDTNEILYAEIIDGKFYYCNTAFTYRLDGNKVVLESTLNGSSEAANYIYAVNGDKLRVYNEEEKTLTDFVRVDQ